MRWLFNDIRNNFSQTGNAVTQLIIINVAIYVVNVIFFQISYAMDGQAVFSVGSTYNTVMKYFGLEDGILEFIWKPWTLVTYMFFHSVSDFWHILPNMLLLYYFGKLIREMMGDKTVVNVYIMGGVTGGLIYLLLYNIIPAFSTTSFLIGASGSVFAIMFAASTKFPYYTFNLLLLGPVNIRYIVWGLFFLSSIFTFASNPGGAMAHAGGALFGYMYIRQLEMGNDLGRPVQFTYAFFKSIFNPKPKMKVHRNYERTKTTSKSGSGYKSTKTKVSSSDEPSQEEIDRILDKIKDSGYESLSKTEKQMLFKASQN